MQVVKCISNHFVMNGIEEDLLEYLEELIEGKIYPQKQLSIYELKRLNFTSDMKIK